VTYNPESVDAAIAQARRRGRVSAREERAIHAVLRGRAARSPSDPRSVQLGRLSKHDRRAFDAGVRAYEAGVKLADNPFHAEERRRLWAAWGQGWWKAEGDSYGRSELWRDDR